MSQEQNITFNDEYEMNTNKSNSTSLLYSLWYNYQ
jgi:hypothetical protein